MDRYDFEEQINSLLGKAQSELDGIEFEMLLSRIEDIVSDYECSQIIGD